MWQPNLGPEFKQEILTAIAADPMKVALALHASESAAQSLLTDWARWTDWADGRAMPVVAVLRDISLMIINSTEACIELFSPEPTTSSIRDLWVLHFEKEHFNFLHVTDFDRLRQILNCIKLGPMRSHAAQLAPTLKGGAAVSVDGLDAVHHLGALMKWHGSEIPPPLSSEQQVMIHTVNVGGLRAHVHEVCSLVSDQSHIFAIQETLLSKQAQRSVTAEVRNHGWHTLWSPPAPLKVTSNGHWRVDRTYPGVGFMYSSEITMQALEPRSQRAKMWFAKGRLLIACIESSKGVRTTFINVYAPAGSASIALRRAFFDDLLQELAFWDRKRLVVLETCSVIGVRLPSTSS